MVGVIYRTRIRSGFPHLSVFHDGHAVAALNVLGGILAGGEEHGCHDVRGMCVKSSD